MTTAQQSAAIEAEAGLTLRLASWLAGFTTHALTPTAIAWSKCVLMDWFAVTIAAAEEPLVRILKEEYAQSTGACTLVAGNSKAALENAVLINASASHALDYDDYNRHMNGHPSVPIVPVALGLAERKGRSGLDVLASIVAGTELECLIGEMVGTGHYEAGYHNTATIGTFGAMGAAAFLLGLNASQVCHALGIAASQLAGLKANYGTMTKPLHAGRAAASGLMAALLAKRGFTANERILECPQGAAAVLFPGFRGGHTGPHPSSCFAIEQTIFKYHAACHLTHAAIDAVGQIRAANKLSLEALQSMELLVHPSLISTCCIETPKTGMEVKFSITHCAVMAFAGMDTASPQTFSDEHALDTELVRAREKVRLRFSENIDRMSARVSIETLDGGVFQASSDVGVPEPNFALQTQKLRQKFDALVSPVIGETRERILARHIRSLHEASSISSMLETAC